MSASIRRVREVTAAEENFRTVRLGPNAATSRRDPVVPEPVGTYFAMVFRVTGCLTDVPQ